MAVGFRALQGPIIPVKRYQRMRKNIDMLSKPWRQRHVKNRQRLVRGWKREHRPRFKADIQFSGRIQIVIIVVNSDKSLSRKYGGTIGLLWLWWEHTGTKAHPIDPLRPAFALRFIPRGESKAIFRMHAEHPGTKPKHKTVAINKRLEAKIPTEWFDPAVNTAFE